MKKEQSFTLYPYSGGDTILLQSSKRFARVNLKNGEGHINDKNHEYANSVRLAMNPLPFTLPEEIKISIQKFLWENDGKDGNINGIMHFERKELFSNKVVEVPNHIMADFISESERAKLQGENFC